MRRAVAPDYSGRRVRAGEGPVPIEAEAPRTHLEIRSCPCRLPGSERWLAGSVRQFAKVGQKCAPFSQKCVPVLTSDNPNNTCTCRYVERRKFARRYIPTEGPKSTHF